MYIFSAEEGGTSGKVVQFLLCAGSFSESLEEGACNAVKKIFCAEKSFGFYADCYLMLPFKGSRKARLRPNTRVHSTEEYHGSSTDWVLKTSLYSDGAPKTD